MADNPLKYSDLIQPDDSIEKAISQLEKLNATYATTLENVRNEAIRLKATIEGASGATEQHRAKIREATEQVDKLSKAQRSLDDAMDDTAKQIAELKMRLQEQNNLNKLYVKRGEEEINLNNLKKKSYEQLSAQYSINKMRLNKMSAEQRKAAEDGEQLVTTTREIYEEMKRLQEETGKHTLNVGNYREAWSGLVAEMSKAGGASGAVAGGFDTMGAAANKFVAHPIVAIVSLLFTMLNKLVEGFKKTEEGITFMNQASAVLSGTMNVIVKISQSVYDSFKAVFSDPIGWVKNLGKEIYQNIVTRFMAIPKLGKAVYGILKGVFTLDADTLKESLSEAGDALVEFNTGMHPEEIREFGNSIKGVTKEIKDQVDAFAELSKARRQTYIANRDLQKQIADLSAEEQLLQAVADDATRSFKEREEAAARADALTKQRAALELQMARKNLEFINTEIDLKKKAGQVDDELLDSQVDAYKEARQAEAEYLLSVQDNTKRVNELKQDRLERDLDILIDGLDNQKTINERLIADETKTFEERRKILEDTRKLSDDSFAKQIETIQQFTGVQVDANELIKEQDAIVLNQRIRSLGLSEIIEGRLLEIVRERRIAIQDLNEAEKELNEDEKTQNAERAKQQKELYKKQQETIEQEYDLRLSEIDLLRATEDEKTKLRLEAERDRMRKLLAMAEAGQTEMSDIEIKTLKNTIALINKEIDKASKAGNKDIYDLVGLKLDDDAKQAISDSVGFSIGQLKEILDAQLQIKEQALQAAQEEKDAAKSRLDAEIEARNNGYANDVATAQKELDLAKRKEEKALREKQKAQRATQALDTLQQTSSLITASAEIWKALAGIPVVGIGLAIAGVSTMWGSFAAAKIKAREATRTEYGEGGMEFLMGGSHQSGNDIDMGTTPDGRQRRAEGGEAFAIFNKTSTRKYRRALPGIIKSINNGTFESKYLNAFGSDGISIQVGSAGFNSRQLESDVREIREQGKKRYIINGNGQMVESYKNLTRVYS
jgi:hypothetical protein